MKNFFSKCVCVVCTIALMSSCYDDSDLRSTLDDHERRLTEVETICRQMNTNITSLQNIVAALQDKDYITGVNPVMQGSTTIGYTISFSKSNPITIYHGTDGKDGANGKDGSNGKDGADGKDGSTPVIGVALSSDGIYYWTLNGTWLFDADGNKIPAIGRNGQDGNDGVQGENGQDGQDGKDGITPQFRIEEGYWYISYDNGKTWTRLGKATGENGKDGQNGTDGQGGDSMFSDIDFTSNPDYVIFTLSNGTQIKIPTWAAFEELQRKVTELNTNLSSLQTIVNLNFSMVCTK